MRERERERGITETENNSLLCIGGEQIVACSGNPFLIFEAPLMRQAALRGGCRLQDWLKSLLFVPAVGLSRLRNPTWGSKKVLFQLRVFQVFFWVGGFSLKSRRHRLLFYRVRALMPSKSAVTTLPSRLNP